MGGRPVAVTISRGSVEAFDGYGYGYGYGYGDGDGDDVVK